ncbi:MAG: hypothetical protein HC890_19070 [Chloroflexaceae bacterium]|nr:hypothetical protein [Chloroflexaceae bacterium]
MSPALTTGYLAQAPELPPAGVVEAVRRELARRSEVPQARLSLIAAMRERWSDGCLGLAKPEELCTQALVEGWRLILSHEQQTWVYRTDATGQQIRLEKSR